MRPEPLVTVHIDAASVATVAMGDSVHGNHLTPALVRGLEEAFCRVHADRRLKAVILRGLPEVFCGGASAQVLSELARGTLQPSELLLPRRVLDIPVPVIAAMEGHAVGGGLALGLCADLVIIARESRYGCSFINMGFTPGMGITRLLEHVLSPAIAHELLYSGEFRRGSDFIGRSGFNDILPRAQVLPCAQALAQRIAEKPRLALELLKRHLSLGRRQCFEQTLTAESMMHQLTFATGDIQSTIEANYVQ